MKGKSLISVLPGPVAAALNAFPRRLAMRQALPALLVLALLTALSLQVQAQQGRIGPVSAQQTLWSIASQNRPDASISVYQYMLALVEANPHAFVAGNANLMREGVMLDLPDAAFATRVSPAEAQRRIEEQIQWHASLSRQELLDILRSDPPPGPALSDESPIRLADTEPPMVDYAIEQDSLVEETESRMPELLAPAPVAELVDTDIPEPASLLEDEWQAAADVVEELAEALSEDHSASELIDQAEEMIDAWLPAEAAIADLLPEARLPESLGALPTELAEVVETAESLVDDIPVEDIEASLSEGFAAEPDGFDWTVTTSPEPVEEGLSPAIQAPVAEQAPAPQAQPASAAPVPYAPVAASGPGALLWVVIGLAVLIGLSLLAWLLRRSRKATADVEPEDDELDEVDESRFPTAASAAAVASLADQDPEMSRSADDDPAGTGSRSASDDWSGLEAAVIGGGPVPIGDPDPQAVPDTDAPGLTPVVDQAPALEQAPAADAATPPSEHKQETPGKQQPVDQQSSAADSFQIEALGWFEEEARTSDDQEQEPEFFDGELIDPEIDSDGAAAASQGEEVGSPAGLAPGLEEVDLASFRGDRDDEPETAEEAVDQVPLDELDLAELNAETDQTPAAPEPGAELDFTDLPDLDAVSEAVAEVEPEQTGLAAEGLELQPLADDAAAELGEAEAPTDLGFDWDLDSAFQPEPASVSEPSISAALEDSEAEVMLDLARLTADAGDAEYAREVLDEVIATGSEEMAQRARELKDSLG